MWSPSGSLMPPSSSPPLRLNPLVISGSNSKPQPLTESWSISQGNQISSKLPLQVSIFDSIDTFFKLSLALSFSLSFYIYLGLRIWLINSWISDGNTVQFSYDVGNGAQVIEYKSTNALNDDQWHTVHVEKNRKEAWLRVDNFPAQTSQEGIGEKTRTLDLQGYLFIGEGLIPDYWSLMLESS